MAAAAQPPIAELAADLSAARQRLQDARDDLDEAYARADGQVRSLQACLAVQPDAELRALAGSPDLGLQALTGGYRVKLAAVLREVAGAGSAELPKHLTRARQLVAEFRFHLQSSERIEACDENPLGVNVAIRSGLGPALAGLNAAVNSFSA